MVKGKMFYLVLVIAAVNLALLVMVFAPQLQQVKHQIEESEAIPAGVFIPTFHDYYYEYILVGSDVEGEWQVDTYQEVKRIVDENGHKIKDIPTGNIEYMRYFKGDDPDTIIFDILDEEEEDHEHDHS